MKNLKMLMLLIIALQTACASLNPKVESSEECAAFQADVHSWAAQVQELDVRPIVYTPGPFEALKACRQEILDLGYTIEHKPQGMGWFGRFTTTMPGQAGGTVFLSDVWDEKTPNSQADIMCHELVHAYTEIRLGWVLSVATYATYAGRSAFEFPSYGVGLQRMKNRGASKESRRKKARRTLKTLHKSYRMENVEYQCFEAAGLSYWAELGVLD